MIRVLKTIPAAIVAAALLTLAGAASSVQAGTITADSYTSPSSSINHLWFDGKGDLFFQDRQSNGTVLGDAIIQITGPTTSQGLFGTLGGSYKVGTVHTFTSGGITVESASVTPIAPAPGGTTDKLAFNDGHGHTFSGDVSFLEIGTTQLTKGAPQSGGIDGDATINLTNVTYNGSNPDLEAFLGAGGTASVNFGFKSSQDLKTLVKSAANAPFTLTVTSAAVPEPASLTLLGLGACGLLGYARRRKAVAC